MEAWRQGKRRAYIRKSIESSSLSSRDAVGIMDVISIDVLPRCDSNARGSGAAKKELRADEVGSK